MLPTTTTTATPINGKKQQQQQQNSFLQSSSSLFSLQTWLLIIIFSVSLLCLHQLYSLRDQFTDLQTTSLSTQAPPTIVRLSDNGKNAVVVREPRNVFIDLGANEGDSLKSFVSDVSSMGGDGIKGRGKSGKWDIWLFEANPHFTERLKKLAQDLSQQKLSNGEKQYTFFTKTEHAITTKDGPVTFFLDTVSDAKWGSSLNPQHRDVVRDKKSITLPGVSLSDLILNHYTKDDFILLKMDVEGIEFDLVTDLMKTGALQLVDELYCEYHDFVSPVPNMANVLRYMVKQQGVKQGNWS